MRIAVTGALGHIGSRLIRDLADAWPASEIVLLDNLATERYASLYGLPATGQYQFIEGDVLTADLEQLFAGADAVIHLAALTNGARADLRDRMQQVNVIGTERVARACASLGIGLLFPSTTSVYGVQGVVSEDCRREDLRPQSPYAEWKLQSEAMLGSLAATEGLRFVLFRMGSIFGPSPGMRFHTAVNQFCWRAVAGQPLEVWRTATHQYRPYLHLEDAVRAMRFVVARRQFDGQIYNVVSVNATVQQVIDVVSGFVPGIRIHHVDSPLMNDLSYTVSSQRFADLGFEFTGTLAHGIGETVAVLSAAQSARADLAFRSW